LARPTGIRFTSELGHVGLTGGAASLSEICGVLSKVAIGALSLIVGLAASGAALLPGQEGMWRLLAEGR
jgi:hypothetical protein